MDTVILTNNTLSPRNESIKVVVIESEAETVPVYSKEASTCTDKSIGTSKEFLHRVNTINGSRQFSVRTGFSQTPFDIRGQGDSKNLIQIRPYSIEKTTKLPGNPNCVRSEIGTPTSSSTNTSTSVRVPYIAKVSKGHDVLEEMKRKLAQSFAKQQNLQRDYKQPPANDPKSSRVPGTDIEYRTPGAHYKNKNGKIKRPMNAFMVWARDYRGYLASSMPNATNSEISVKLGQIWASMPPQEKKQYYDVAEKIKAKHRQDYPDWVYQPSAPTLKKKDDAVVYTRTPTPPLNFMFSRLGQTESVHSSSDEISGQEAESENAVQRQLTETFSDATSGNVGSDFCLNQSPRNKDASFQAIQQRPEHDKLNVNQYAANTSTGASNIRPLYVTRVSYQSALEIPTENTVSDTTRGLLANKISQGRAENVNETPPDRRYYQQRAPFIKRPNISITPNRQPSVSQNIFGTVETPMTSYPFKILEAQTPRIMSIVASPLHGHDNVRLHAIRPSLMNELIPNVKRLSPHVIPDSQQVRPQMFPNARQMIPLTPTPKWTMPDQRQKVDGVRNPMGIPIVETHISPISAHVRSINQGSKTENLSSSVAATHLKRQFNVPHSKNNTNDENKDVSKDESQVKSATEVSNNKQTKSAADAGNNKQTKYTADAGNNKQTKSAGDTGNDLRPKSAADAGNNKQTKSAADAGDNKQTKSAADAGINKQPKSAANACDHIQTTASGTGGHLRAKIAADIVENVQAKSAADSEDQVHLKSGIEGTLTEDSRELIFQPKDFKTEVDALWPFPFSENPADWDIKEFPKAAYLELFDPYDPFLTADILSDTFPGSLHLDMDRWNHYIEEENEEDSDPFNSLKYDKTDDISVSPLPLKQTLCRLLNVHVQASDTGDIITGDIIAEVTSVEDETGENAENRELLTNEIARQISHALNETEKDKDLNEQITKHVLDSILDEITPEKNTNTGKSEIGEVENTKSEIFETETTDEVFTGKEDSSDVETFKGKTVRHIVKTTDTPHISFINNLPEKSQHVLLEIEANSKSKKCTSENLSDISSVKYKDRLDSINISNNATDFTEHTPTESKDILNTGLITKETEKTYEDEVKAEDGGEVVMKTSRTALANSHNTRSRSRVSKLL